VDQEPDVPEVRPPTIDDVRRLCRALDEAQARYVLIGGFAVILPGGERTTKDVDLLARFLTLPRVRGAVVHDARVAALCVAHGVEALLTRDRDFSLFSDLRTRNPFA